ncbi:MAG: biopolymer transporter ExbD [Bacteroidetes bacterium]|nr:biopolymer transporter ExbD [Bacteroidota bacterium]
MAEITANPVKEKRRGIARQKRHSLRVDMTPMVDLGFLLITFFIFSAEIANPKATSLNMPKDKGPQTPVGESYSMSILLGKNNTVYMYMGKWEGAEKQNRVITTSYDEKTGIGNLIRMQQERLSDTSKYKEGRRGLMLLIKPSESASYQNVVSALDEALINDVKKYALVQVSAEEKTFIINH